MKARYFTLLIAASFLATGAAQAQSKSKATFRKGTLSIGLTEGATFSKYTTTRNNSAVIGPATNDGGHVAGTADVIGDGNVNGDRDPICIEYGLSDKIGISLSMGGDVLHVNTDKYYSLSLPGKTDAITSETTIDINYHFYSRHKVDLACYLSMGLATVTLSDDNGDANGSYSAHGSIARLGTRARYYFGRHIGVMGMVSTFFTSTKAGEGKDGAAAGSGIDTRIKGWTIEVGPCVRLLK